LTGKLQKYLQRLNPQLRELVSGSFVAFFFKFLGGVLIFGLNAFIARSLGAEKAGIYFLSFTITMIIVNIGRFGMDSSIVRYIASYASVGDWSRVKGVYREGIGVTLIGTAILTLLAYLIYPKMTEVIFKKPEILHPLNLMLLLIIPTTFVVMVGEAFRGLKQIARSTILQNIVTPALVISSFIIFGIRGEIDNIIELFTFGALLSAAIAIVFWLMSNHQFRRIKAIYISSKLINMSRPLFLVNLLNLIIMWSPTLVLGIFRGNDQVGIFNVAARTAGLMNFMLISLNAIAAPQFAELYHRGDLALLCRSARNVTKMIIVMSLPVLFVFLVFPGAIMGIFGEQFITGAPILFVLTLGYFFNVATGSVGYLLLMSSNEKLVRNATIIVVVINLLLSFLLIPRFGMMGAAVTSALSIIILMAIFLILVKKRLHFWTISFLDRIFP